MNNLIQLLAVNSVSVPVYEVLAVLAVQGLSYLLRIPRLGLMVSCAFVYHLGWCFLRARYGAESMPLLIAYVAFGIFLIALALYGRLRENEPA
jgi:hypothetical protein